MSYITFLFKFQLVDTKSGDKKTTLMHFLVMTVQDKFQDLLNFDSELRFLDKAAVGKFCKSWFNQLTSF